jgi:hypothetical protein
LSAADESGRVEPMATSERPLYACRHAAPPAAAMESHITITTRLVDTVTTPMLLKTVKSRKIEPKVVDQPSFQACRYSGRV